MTSYVVLYHGASLSDAKVVAVSANPQIVAQVAGEMLRENPPAASATDDPVLRAIGQGRRRALRLVTGATQ